MGKGVGRDSAPGRGAPAAGTRKHVETGRAVKQRRPLVSAATALTIAGSDCGGLAGVAGDLRAFWAFGVRGACAVTAVTAQDDAGMRESGAVDAGHVALQVACVLDALPVTSVKTGMLVSAATVEAVACELERRRSRGLRLVVDPVLAASSGASLLDDAGREAFVARLLPMADVVTPNLPEAATLLGRDPAAASGWTRAEQAQAARDLLASGCRAALVKGGHRESGAACDALAHGGALTWFEAPRVEAALVRGTGCTLSAAIAAGLALGWDLERSVRAAKAFLTDALRRGLDVPPPPFDARRAGDLR